MFFPAYALYANPRLPYLQSQQGKVAELRLELNNGGKKDKNHSAKKIALKKIVANMTMSNNDMVTLFEDIVECMKIPSLEIKKMYVGRSGALAGGCGSRLTAGADGRFRCFLYLVNYARIKSDVALRALPIILHVRVQDPAGILGTDTPLGHGRQ